MHSGTARLSIGLLLLAGLWIVVYWWWPSAPPISFAQPASSQPTAAQPTADQPGAEVPSPAPVQPVPAPHPDPLPPAVIPPEFFDHAVQKGETLDSISKRYFGTTRHASAIARANPLLDPSRLREGRVIRIPRDPDNIQGIPTAPEPKPADTPLSTRAYTVRSGDTLSKISKAMYGTTRHAKLIFEANRDQLHDEDSLALGQQLKIPPAPTE